MTIKVKLYNGQKVPKVIKKGDWIDIYTVSEIRLWQPLLLTEPMVRDGWQQKGTPSVG